MSSNEMFLIEISTIEYNPGIMDNYSQQPTVCILRNVPTSRFILIKSIWCGLIRWVFFEIAFPLWNHISYMNRCMLCHVQYLYLDAIRICVFTAYVTNTVKYMDRKKLLYKPAPNLILWLTDFFLEEKME